MSEYLTVEEVARLARASVRAERDFARLGEASPSISVVYVIQRGDHGPFKIGRVGQVRWLVRRLSALQTGSAESLLLRRLLPSPSAPEMESILHEWFAQDRLEGEWFAPHPHLIRFATGTES